MLMETIDRAVFGACRSIEPAENHAFRRPRSKRPETRTLPSSVVAPMSSGVPLSSSPGSSAERKKGVILLSLRYSAASAVTSRRKDRASPISGSSSSRAKR